MLHHRLLRILLLLLVLQAASRVERHHARLATQLLLLMLMSILLFGRRPKLLSGEARGIMGRSIMFLIFDSCFILNVLFLVASAHHETIDRAVMMLSLLALQLQVILLVMILLISDGAFFRDVIVLIYNRVLVSWEYVVVALWRVIA